MNYADTGINQMPHDKTTASLYFCAVAIAGALKDKRYAFERGSNGFEWHRLGTQPIANADWEGIASASLLVQPESLADWLKGWLDGAGQGERFLLVAGTQRIDLLGAEAEV